MPIGLLLSAAFLSQTAPLSRPELEKPVSVEIKRTLVAHALKEFQGATGVAFRVSKDLDNQKITIFAKEKAAKELLAAVADTLGASWVTDEKTLVLVPNHEAERSAFLKAEDDLMTAEANRRFDLLADLTRSEVATAIPEEDGDNMTVAAPPFTQFSPKDWAAQAVRDPLYFALGVWARVPKGSQAQALRTPRFFRIKAPVSSHESRANLCAIDENSKPIENTFIAGRFLIESGEVQVGPISTAGSFGATPVSTLPYRFAEPPTLLRETPYGKRIVSWGNELPESAMTKTLSGTRTIKTPFHDNRFGIADVLEDLHKRSGYTIVADDFRVGAKSLTPTAPSTFGSAVIELRSRERCSIRFDGEILRLRHPAFWRLRRSEPPESLMATYEERAAKGPLTLRDYSLLALGIRDHYLGSMERFLVPERILTKFNPLPLYESMPALSCLGNFEDAQFESLISGEPFKLTDGKGRSDAWDIPAAARLGVFYKHVMNPRMSAALEAGISSVEQHLSLTNRLDDVWRKAGVANDPANTVWVEFGKTNIPKVNFGFSPQACITYPISIPSK